MKLRSNLYLMVAGALAPVVLLAIAATVLLVRHERETMEEEAIGRTRSAMSAIDAEIRGHLTALQALAVSRALEAGDLRAFYEETRRVLAGQPGWRSVVSNRSRSTSVMCESVRGSMCFVRMCASPYER